MVSKGKKVLLGVLTLWTSIFFFASYGFFFLFLYLFVEKGDAFFSAFPWVIVFVFALTLLTMLLLLGLIVFYLTHLFKNPNIKEDLKPLWAVLMLFANIIVLPIYWFLYIFKAKN